ncbi:hypothetical protein pb186bvf_016933 [Paramecium bursaria]
MSSIRQIYILKNFNNKFFGNSRTFSSLLWKLSINGCMVFKFINFFKRHFMVGDFEKFLQLSTAGSVFMLFGFYL